MYFLLLDLFGMGEMLNLKKLKYANHDVYADHSFLFSVNYQTTQLINVK